MKDTFRTNRLDITEEQRNLIVSIKSKASELLDIIYASGWGGRESSLAVTRLEECVMWAVKSITQDKVID